ncbi:hypothetical protein FRC04_001559 [Tulasnella sp. 424]|nr:hypothetical protein FRC04_001559 [Tulasnella sp. 424]
MSPVLWIGAVLVSAIQHLFGLTRHQTASATLDVVTSGHSVYGAPNETTEEKPSDPTAWADLDLRILSNLTSTMGVRRLEVQLHLEDRLGTMLSRWFTKPLAFREMLQVTQSAISGSAALQFAVPSSSWTCKDLDVYTPKGEPCNEMIKHLVEVQGYVIEGLFPSSKADKLYANAKVISTHNPVEPRHLDCVVAGPSTSTHDAKPPPIAVQKPPSGDYQRPKKKEYYYGGIRFIHRIYVLQKTFPADDGTAITRRIDVICSDSAASLRPITDFHSTCVMNVITGAGVLVAYPNQTFNGTNIRRIHSLGGRQDHVDKYTARGFCAIDSVGTSPCSPSSCPQLRRTFSDAGCFAMPFRGSKHPLDCARDVSWGLHSAYLSICPTETCSYRPVV